MTWKWLITVWASLFVGWFLGRYVYPYKEKESIHDTQIKL